MNSLTPTFNYVYWFTADEKLCGAPIEKKNFTGLELFITAKSLIMLKYPSHDRY